MIFLAHAGGSLYAARRLAGQAAWSRRAALVVVFFALLPDLVDKPIFYLGYAPIPGGRLWGHTLLFSACLCLLSRWRLRQVWPWVLACPGHLLLDGMWDYPHTLLWPLLGNYFDWPDMVFANHLERWLWMYHHEPWSLAGLLAAEAAGLALAWLALRPLAAPRAGTASQAATTGVHLAG